MEERASGLPRTPGFGGARFARAAKPVRPARPADAARALAELPKIALGNRHSTAHCATLRIGSIGARHCDDARSE